MALNFDPAHRAAIKWASAQVDVQGVELLSDNAWACTYCLSGPAGASYLKILPPCSRGAVLWTVQIARQLAGKVPQVVAAAADHGWILFTAHGGRDWSENDDLTEVARCFAAIQAEAAQSGALSGALNVIDITSMPQSLMAFLTAPSRPVEANASVGASYFIGDDEARRYARLLRPRLALLTPCIAAAASLPLTLCHGDLQARNVGVKPDGQVVLFDWDDAAWGPAGLCLPGLFPGCTLAAVLVGRKMASGTAGNSQPARCLEAYVQALVEGGYSSEGDLLAGLVGSMGAGRMRFVISFGRYPGDQHHEACAETVRGCLSDLLDLCDWLATREPGKAMVWAQNYEQQGEWRRARQLVEDQLAREPKQLDALTLYAHLAYEQGDLALSYKAAQLALSVAPTETAARMAMARCCLRRLDLSASAALLSEVIQAEPDNVQAKEWMSRVQTLTTAQEMATEPQAVPCIALSAREHDTRQLAPETLALMVQLFKTYGVVQVNNLFSADKLANLQKAFSTKYRHKFHDGEHPDDLDLGGKRFMLTMELDDTFGDEEIVASSLMLPFLEKMLGDECLLNAYTSVISLPGSAPQAVHKDHAALFYEHGWNFSHPSFAVQLVIPLLELNQVTGATRVYKRSQRLEDDTATELPYQDPVVPLGSCLLIDYSVAHCGMANHSDKVRPILNLVYARPWFRDDRNYHLQPPLKFSTRYFNGAPESVRKLVNWWAIQRRLAGQSDAA